MEAVDADGDQLEYGMRGTEAYYFSVSSDTGNVTLKQTVDYEVKMNNRIKQGVDRTGKRKLVNLLFEYLQKGF